MLIVVLVLCLLLPVALALGVELLKFVGWAFKNPRDFVKLVYGSFIIYGFYAVLSTNPYFQS